MCEKGPLSLGNFPGSTALFLFETSGFGLLIRDPLKEIIGIFFR